MFASRPEPDLEADLAEQLDRARRELARGLTEARVGEIAHGLWKINSVEEIDGFGAHLEGSAASKELQLEGTLHGEVSFRETWPAIRVAAKISFAARHGCREFLICGQRIPEHTSEEA